MEPEPTVEVPVLPLPLTQRLSAGQWRAVDAVVAALLVAASVAAIATSRGRDLPIHQGQVWNGLRFVLVLAAAAALPFRRAHPRPALAVTAAAGATLILVGSRGPIILAVVMAVYTVASTSPPRESLRAATAVVTLVTAASLVAGGWAGIVAPLPLLIGWLAGENSRTRRAYIARVHAWAAERDREREERSRRAVADERLRVARELHDVVAHAMSVVAVRSGVARAVADRQPEEARRALEIIETTSRRALQEMRLMVGVLRDGDSAREYAPAPGLADLARLVEQIEAAGVAVALEVVGEPRPLPAAVDVSAYRIVQEALTNVVRHAGPATARLTVRYRAHQVELEVVDDGAGGRQAAGGSSSLPLPDLSAGGGHGLVGMRERAGLFGGTLRAGPTPTGWQVVAVLPVDDRADDRADELSASDESADPPASDPAAATEAGRVAAPPADAGVLPGSALEERRSTVG